MLLKNKIIFLTGGAAGIGFECAKAYLQEGAKVVVFDKNQSNTEGVLNIKGDVSKAKEVEEAIKKTLETHGRIDAIHNNACIAHPSKALHDTTEEEWDNLMMINLKSVFLTTKYAFEALKLSKGCILNTSSMVGSINIVYNHLNYTNLYESYFIHKKKLSAFYIYNKQLHRICTTERQFIKIMV
jgi:NAD(P)-dependent dehydrogenase (short-subunit alcohol dehydrogenase family)